MVQVHNKNFFVDKSYHHIEWCETRT